MVPAKYPDYMIIKPNGIFQFITFTSITSCFTAMALGADSYLTPESLAKPRAEIALVDSSLRVFNQRGCVSARDWTVCGVKLVRFPPINLLDYRFGLSFRERTTGTLIVDNQDEYRDPLYLNQRDKDPNLLISQDATWQPNLYTRTGTYHRYHQGRLISFGVTSKLSVSAEADEIFLSVDVTNRGSETLDLTVIPDQVKATNTRPDVVLSALAGTLQPPQPSGTNRPPVFTWRDKGWQVAAASDLPLAGDAGWDLEIPANSHQVFRLVLSLAKAPDTVQPPSPASDLAARIQRGQQATRDELTWAAERLPQIRTGFKALDEFYQRSELTLLMCRLNRPNYVATPFYDYGHLDGASVLWDLSFASPAIALLEPGALKGMVRTHLKSGIFNATYTDWQGKGHGWYAQSPFALLRIVNDYLAQTGDTNWLNETTPGQPPLYEQLCDVGTEFHKRYARSDGLIDIGDKTTDMLEIRTSDYYHVLPVINGLASDYYRQMVGWAETRHDPRAAAFKQWSQQLSDGVQTRMWDQPAGWFVGLFPDNSRHLVMSYHLFDLLGAASIRADQRQVLVEHLKRGDFTDTFGLHSIAPSDRIHYDREDCDWGGGGQYIGMSARIIESLYRLGERATAWDILKRCTRWTEGFPYWPQTIYADQLALQPHQIDWPLQLSGGGGVTTVTAGVFGIHPQLDGTLEFEPSCEPELGEARLSGYHFRGNTYDVEMSKSGFRVYQNGHLATQGHPGEKVECR